MKSETQKQQAQILYQFWGECVQYWERTLGVDSDLSKEPYIHALREIPKNNPYVVHVEPLDPYVITEFRKSRYMDTYGRSWKMYYQNDGYSL